jgi:choline dehydrogenase-like flavoprotein
MRGTGLFAPGEVAGFNGQRRDRRNQYGQSWDHPNLFLMGSSTFPTMGTGFNPR